MILLPFEFFNKLNILLINLPLLCQHLPQLCILRPNFLIKEFRHRILRAPLHLVQQHLVLNCLAHITRMPSKILPRHLLLARPAPHLDVRARKSYVVLESLHCWESQRAGKAGSVVGARCAVVH